MKKISLSRAIQMTKTKVDHGISRPSLYLGQAGIGKTASFESLAKDELKIGYKDVRLAQYSGVDAKGIPVPDLEKGITRWLMDGMLPREELDGEKGLFVIDEATSIEDPTVQTMLYQLTNERRVGEEYELPKGWTIVLLGNREEDGGDYYGLLAPLRDRCDIFEVTFDLDLWVNWAISQGVNPLVISYLKQNPTVIHTYDPDKEGDKDGMIFATPRSWTGASEILNLSDVDIDLRIDMIQGALPRAISSDFVDYFEIGYKLPSTQDIILGKVKRSDIDESVRDVSGFILFSMIGSYLKSLYRSNEEVLSKGIDDSNKKVYNSFSAVIDNSIKFMSDYDLPLIEAFISFIGKSKFSDIALERVYTSSSVSKYSTQIKNILDKFNK